MPLKQEAPVFREALALAAAAARDKGAVLSARGLGDYARSLMEPSLTGLSPAEQLEVDPDGGNGSDSSGSDNGTGSGDRKGQGKNHLSPDELKEKVSEISEKNPLLNLLNRLPGKNGQRWIVLPFSFTGEGIEYRVSLRILLRETSLQWPNGSIPAKIGADYLNLDISGGDRRRRFIITREGDDFSRIKLLLWPPEKKRAVKSMQKALACLFQLQPEQVIITNSSEFPPFAENSEDEVLPYVNKEV
jgi:hypothetical protein